MATTIKLQQEVTIGTTPTEYLIDTTNALLTSPVFDVAIAMTSTNTGTIQFAVGETPPASQRACVASEKIVLPVQNGLYNLWAVASLAGQKFTIS
jgi:hypothetical protein